jgi:hypothetical protein
MLNTTIRPIRFIAALSTLILLVLPSDAWAYGRKVHGRITETAFSRLSVDFRARLGITATTSIAGQTAQEWMIQGSQEEDNFPRPICHFFDPVNKTRLTIGRYPGFCFSILGTNRADWWALDPSKQGVQNGSDIADAAAHYREAVLGPNPGSRAVGGKYLFLDLGHVVHLVEDMSQPEHTRNDQHLTYSNFFLNNGYKPSIYESWADDWIAPATKNAGVSKVSFNGYPVLSLDSFESYFTTDQRTPDDRSVGRGLADFANRSFVTQDTNYGDYSPRTQCEIYPEPRIADATMRSRDFSYSVYAPDGSIVLQKVREDVFSLLLLDDNVTFDPTDDFHSHYSSIDIETRRYDPSARFYSLSDESYNSRAQMLIPRATGYAAGLVQRFFSGKLDAAWTKNPTTGKWDVKITNLGSEKIGADARIKVIYLAAPSYFGYGNSDDTARILDDPLAALVPNFAGIAAGASVEIKGFSIPFLRGSDPITQFERRIVIEGTVGKDSGRVVSLVQNPIAITKKSYDLDCWSGGRCLLYAGTPNETDFEEVSIGGGTWTRECTFTDTIPSNATITAMKANVQEIFVADSFSQTERMAVKINTAQSTCCQPIQASIVGLDHACFANPTSYDFVFPTPSIVPYVKGGTNKLTLIGTGDHPGTSMWLIRARVDLTYEVPIP